MAPGLVLGGAVVHGRAGKVQLGHAVHVAVVRDGHRGHAEVHGALDHVADTRGAVQHGVLGVVVQVNECHGRGLPRDVRLCTRCFSGFDSTARPGRGGPCRGRARGKPIACSRGRMSGADRDGTATGRRRGGSWAAAAERQHVKQRLRTSPILPQRWPLPR